MGSYKVPQDVEADDKLLGPFSFRQFIYLLVVVMAGGMAYGLFLIFPILVIIPIPFMLFFGILALPLKKDQPMETYVGALVSFYFLKPRKRMWQPDGLDSLVEITAPNEVEERLSKNISQQEARARIGYLSDIVESDGWAVRGIGVPKQGVGEYDPIQDDESDLLGEDNSSAQRFDKMLDTQSQTSLDQARAQFQQQLANTPPTPETPAPMSETTAPQPQQQSATPAHATSDDPKIEFNPYPQQIRQSVVQPLSERGGSAPAERPNPQDTARSAITPPARPDQSTSANQPSPDIIKLANDSGYISIATVAEQAHRLRGDHSLPEDEVEISLH